MNDYEEYTFHIPSFIESIARKIDEYYEMFAEKPSIIILEYPYYRWLINAIKNKDLFITGMFCNIKYGNNSQNAEITELYFKDIKIIPTRKNICEVY